jgi:hypothetical protein
MCCSLSMVAVASIKNHEETEGDVVLGGCDGMGFVGQVGLFHAKAMPSDCQGLAVPLAALPCRAYPSSSPLMP